MTRLTTAGQYTLLCIASLTIMVGSVVAPGLISIAAGLGITENSVLLVTLPALGAVLFAPIAGKIIDRYGAYPSLVIGLFLYGLIGASVYLLHGPTHVFANRILLGGVTAIVMAACTVLISQWYFGHERLGMIAKQGMAIELGGVIFLFVGGLLAAQYWGLPLAIYLLAWLFLVMLVALVPRKHPVEPKDESPIVDTVQQLGMSIKTVYLIAVLAMVIFFTSTVSLPLVLHERYYSEEEVGILLAFISMVAVITAHFLPRMTGKLGEQNTLLVAFIGLGISYVCFIQPNYFVSWVGAVASGIGFGFSIPLLNHMTVERSPLAVRGRNLSYFTMAVFSGQFLTSFVEYIPGALTNVYILNVAACVIIVLALFFTGKKGVASNGAEAQ